MVIENLQNTDNEKPYITSGSVFCPSPSSISLPMIKKPNNKQTKNTTALKRNKTEWLVFYSMYLSSFEVMRQTEDLQKLRVGRNVSYHLFQPSNFPFWLSLVPSEYLFGLISFYLRKRSYLGDFHLYVCVSHLRNWKPGVLWPGYFFFPHPYRKNPFCL